MNLTVVRTMNLTGKRKREGTESYRSSFSIGGKSKKLQKEGPRVRVEIRESERSKPDAPLWTWRLWDSGRSVAFGVCTTQTAARDQAARAREAREQRPVFIRPGLWR